MKGTSLRKFIYTKKKALALIETEEDLKYRKK